MNGARATIACVLAWLAPGAGHLYLGRRLRAAVFFVVVMTTFSLGLAFEGKPSVIDRRQPLLSYLQVFANVGTGPMEAVAREKIFGQLAYRLPPEDAGPDPHSTIGLELRRRTQSEKTPYGTAYLWTAGLMNILLILDAFDIAIGRKQ
ncbi:MAG: hypothetical protein DMF49_05130 [Acidobacteria bacterium]|nr:MAG: hypothetical protein DMF49_05130 [Acidobacteriota bacterium]